MALLVLLLRVQIRILNTLSSIIIIISSISMKFIIIIIIISLPLIAHFHLLAHAFTPNIFLILRYQTIENGLYDNDRYSPCRNTHHTATSRNLLLMSNTNNYSSNSPYTPYTPYTPYSSYSHSNLQKKFQKDGILYKKSILSKSEFDIIQTEVMNIPKHNLQNEKSNTVARERIGMTLSNDSPIVKILGDVNGSLYQLMNEIALTSCWTSEGGGHDHREQQPKMILSDLVPVEVGNREYRLYNMTRRFDFV